MAAAGGAAAGGAGTADDLTDERQVPTDPVTGRVMETPEARVDGLRRLRALMALSLADKTVERYPRNDDQFLLAFLRARKYNVPKAHAVLNNFAAMWYNPRYRDIINGTCSESCRAFNDLHIVRNLMPLTDRKGNVLSAMYAGNADFSSITFAQQFRNTLFGFFAMLDSDEAQLHGMTMVETFEGFSLLHSMSAQRMMSGSEQKELMNMFTDTVPIRLRDIWVVKQPWYFSVFWGIVKPFMKRKLTKRVHLVGNDRAALHEAIDPAHLPPEFWGTNTSVGWDDWLNQTLEQERRTGKLGGFAVPLNVDDPTGELRAAQAATATAGSPTTAVGGAGASHESALVGGGGATDGPTSSVSAASPSVAPAEVAPTAVASS